MAVAARAFFSLGIEKLFGAFVIFVMTFITFFVLGFGMTKVKGFVHTDRAPVGNNGYFFFVASTAGCRAAFLPGGSGLSVAADTFGMVDVLNRFFSRILQAFEFGRLAVVDGEVAYLAVFVIFFNLIAK